jgi:cytochrome c
MKGGEVKEAISTCSVNELKGKALDTKSQEMKDIVAYIKSLEKKTPAVKTKAKEYVNCQRPCRWL